MPALGDRLDHLGDVMSVFEDRLALLDVLERDLVAQRHSVDGSEIDRAVALHHPAGQGLARLHVLDDDHADIVGLVVHDEMRRPG